MDYSRMDEYNLGDISPDFRMHMTLSWSVRERTNSTGRPSSYRESCWDTMTGMTAVLHYMMQSLIWGTSGILPGASNLTY